MATVDKQPISAEEIACLIGERRLRFVEARVIWTWNRWLRPLEWLWRRCHAGWHVMYVFEHLSRCRDDGPEQP